jgi:uncharacterized peroxidase-related enzyme
MSEISRFRVASLDELPADLRNRIEPIAERTGFVPNVFLGMTHRPDELRAFMDFHDALMERESGLSKAEREMIVVATSAANDCLYCVVAHGAILRIRAKDPEIADRIAANWRSAPVTERQRAMLAFAVKLARTPETVTDESEVGSRKSEAKPATSGGAEAVGRPAPVRGSASNNPGRRAPNGLRPGARASKSPDQQAESEAKPATSGGAEAVGRPAPVRGTAPNKPRDAQQTGSERRSRPRSRPTNNRAEAVGRPSNRAAKRWLQNRLKTS